MPLSTSPPFSPRALTALLHGLPPVGTAVPLAPASARVLARAPAPPLAPVVSLVGAGGKSTLLYALAHALASSGLKVITATTTHIFPPTPADSPCCLLSPTLSEVENALHQHDHVTVTGPSVITKNQLHKLSGLSFEALAALRSVANLLLVEADGAAMHPLKAPASHEPAVPPCTQVCIALCGLSGLGLPLHASVHRPELAAALCGCLPTEAVIPAHLAHLTLHPQGLFRTTPYHAARSVLCTLPPATPGGMTAAAGHALASQACKAAQALYPHHAARWWAGSALEGWVAAL